MNQIKNILNVLQFICVLMILLSALQYVWSDVELFSFAKIFNDFSIEFFSKFISLNINGTDWTLVFLVLPWVLYIIIISFILNMFENLTHKVDEAVVTYRHKKISEYNTKQQEIKRELLQKKQTIYAAISIILSKFTISNLSDNEIAEKIQEIKKDLLHMLSQYHGKYIADEEFDDPNTFALIFYSQDAALNYIMKVKEVITIMENDIQQYGYTIGTKIVLDAQNPEAIQFYVLQFMEKVLNAVEIDEICTTNTFADRYIEYGQMKNFTFISKGNYSINKERVELKKMTY